MFFHCKKEKPRGFRRGLLVSVSIVAKWMELLCHVDLADSMMDMCVGDLTDLARQVWGKRVSPLRSSQMTRTASVEMADSGGWKEQAKGKDRQKQIPSGDDKQESMASKRSMIWKKTNMVDLTGEVP